MRICCVSNLTLRQKYFQFNSRRPHSGKACRRTWRTRTGTTPTTTPSIASCIGKIISATARTTTFPREMSARNDCQIFLVRSVSRINGPFRRAASSAVGLASIMHALNVVSQTILYLTEFYEVNYAGLNEPLASIPTIIPYVVMGSLKLPDPTRTLGIRVPHMTWCVAGSSTNLASTRYNQQLMEARNLLSL